MRTAAELAARVSCVECQFPLGGDPSEVPPARAQFRAPAAPSEHELVRCEVCGTTYRVDAQVVARGDPVQCTSCLGVFIAPRPPRLGVSARVEDPPRPAPTPAPPVVAPVAAESPSPFRSRRGFIGVTAARAASVLHDHGRRLPLDVWFALADDLMDLLKGVGRGHERWDVWTGPHSFGIDLEGAFVAFDDLSGRADLHEAWVHPTLPAQLTWLELGRARVWAVCRALVWLLDPFPTGNDGAGARVERVFAHPELPPALHAVLDSGLGMTGPADLRALRTLVHGALNRKPASRARVQAVLFAVGFQVPPQDELPPYFRDGALQVHLDRLLERAPAIERCPSDPRAVAANPLSMPLTPTRALDLTVMVDAQPVRRIPVTAGHGFPGRVALPTGTVLGAGQRVALVVSHPEQRAFKVDLLAVVGDDGCATPVIDARTRAELDVLWSSLDADAAPPALVPPRPEPQWELPQPESRRGWPVLAVAFVFLLVVTVPILIVVGLLALAGVISEDTALAINGLLVLLGLLVFFGGRERP
jgi:predicted Zn finger-like uncharacterized protein